MTEVGPETGEILSPIEAGLVSIIKDDVSKDPLVAITAGAAIAMGVMGEVSALALGNQMAAPEWMLSTASFS